MNELPKDDDLNARVARLEKLVEEQGRRLQALDKAAKASRTRAEQARHRADQPQQPQHPHA